MNSSVRSVPQREFDGYARGWAFCNARMLRSKVNTLTPLAQELDDDDPRHMTLESMRQQLASLEELS